MPSVSVVLPIYNNAHYLDECLSSVMNQTMQDLEIICVNDGSTDGSLEIIQRYAAADERFIVIDKPNTGYGNSMNVGCDLATGEYLTVLESDDIFPLDACETMYRFAKDNGDLDFLKADAQMFFGVGDERRFEYLPASENTHCYEGVFDSSADPGRYFARGGQPGMYRVAFLRDRGIIYHDSPGATFQDTSYWAQVMFAGHRVRYLDRSCYLIRRDNEGSSEADGGKVYDICHEYDFVRKRIDEMDDIDIEKCRYACSYYRYWNYRWTCGRIAASSIRGFISYFSKEFNELDAKGELDRSYFKHDELSVLGQIMDDPDAYYFENYRFRRELDELHARIDGLKCENEDLRQQLSGTESELAEVYSSKRYRLGTALSAPARIFKHE